MYICIVNKNEKTMTVEELIQELKTLDPKKEIFVEHTYDGSVAETDIIRIKEEKFFSESCGFYVIIS